MSELHERLAPARIFERMSVIEAMRTLLDGTGWYVQSHSRRTEYLYRAVSLEAGSLLNQLEWLADSVACSVVVNNQYQMAVIIDNPDYDASTARDDVLTLYPEDDE